MSTFRRRFTVVVDGLESEIESRPADFLGAERDLAHEGIDNPTQAPIRMQMRVVWRAWARSNPDRPGAHDWAKFLEIFDDATEDEDQGEPLTPTRAAESGS